MTLVSEDEAEPIHSAIVRKEAWTQDAVRRLRADADRHMREGSLTVVSERPKGVDLDPHDYYSEAPYWWPDPANPSGPYLRRDGEINPDRFTANRRVWNFAARLRRRRGRILSQAEQIEVGPGARFRYNRISEDRRLSHPGCRLRPGRGCPHDAGLGG